MHRWWPLALFALALSAALWRAPLPDAVVFAGAPAPRQPPLAREFFSEQLPAAQGRIGASTLARLPDGRLIVVWQENRSGEAEDNHLRLLAQDRQGIRTPPRTRNCGISRLRTGCGRCIQGSCR